MSVVSNKFKNLHEQSELFYDKSNLSLKIYFLEGLKNIYYAEHMLVKMWQQMEEDASSEIIGDTFEDQKFITLKYVYRLENIFNLLGEKPDKKNCKAIDSLIAEGNEILNPIDEGIALRDIALIFTAQKIAHYEIASYCGLSLVAKSMGHNQISRILGKTLYEVEETLSDKVHLSKIFIKMEACTKQDFFPVPINK